MSLGGGAILAGGGGTLSPGGGAIFTGSGILSDGGTPLLLALFGNDPDVGVEEPEPDPGGAGALSRAPRFPMLLVRDTGGVGTGEFVEEVDSEKTFESSESGGISDAELAEDNGLTSGAEAVFSEKIDGTFVGKVDAVGNAVTGAETVEGTPGFGPDF